MAGNKPGPDKGDPRMVEAGRRGGQAMKKKYEGGEFFQKIGKKGGKTTKERYGPEFFSVIGKKGGESAKGTRAKKVHE